MNDKSSRPEIEVTVSNLDEYEAILIGFPVWWETGIYVRQAEKVA